MGRPKSTEQWEAPDKVEELFESTDGNVFAAINQPTAGAREERELARGKEDLQLYSLATPNGQKVSIVLEELGLPYDAHHISILNKEQFTSGFVAVNPNSKIPALMDWNGPGGKPVRLFESGSIALYLCEKAGGKLVPKDPALRWEMMNWVMWQMANQGPFTGGGYGHFYRYAPANLVDGRNYAVARYGMEVQRMLDVLDRHLSDGRTWILGDEFSLADCMLYPWVRVLDRGYPGSFEFLSMGEKKHVMAWCARMRARPAVQRGLRVCASPDRVKPDPSRVFHDKSRL